MTLTMRYAARSDVGLVRQGNEDSGFASPNLLVVADGMGGHAAGELASATAVATFAEVADAPLPESGAVEMLEDAVDVAGERIGDIIATQPEFQGMGTTVTAVAWLGEQIAVAHVGDSRAYLLRDGELAQITKDHTYVQSLVDAGRITAEEANTHPRRNLIMRAIDGVHNVDVDVSVQDLRAGDRLMLCSDGLSGVVPDDVLAEVLSTGEPTGTVIHLLDLALDAGAPDNVTILVADVVEVDAPETMPERPVVVGAAGEPYNRARLPQVPWPEDQQPDPTTSAPPHPAPTPEPDEADAPPSVRKTWIRVALGVVVAVLMFFAVAGVSLIIWIQAQWYVGAYDGSVAIYRGVPGTLGPIGLQGLEQATGIDVATLPTFDQDRVQLGIRVSSRDQAVSTVSELDARSQECQSASPPAGCPDLPDPEPAPRATVSATPTPGASP